MNELKETYVTSYKGYSEIHKNWPIGDAIDKNTSASQKNETQSDL